jgi:hypothetical protein
MEGYLSSGEKGKGGRERVDFFWTGLSPGIKYTFLLFNLDNREGIKDNYPLSTYYKSVSQKGGR